MDTPASADETYRSPSIGAEHARLAWGVITALAVVKVAVHLYTNPEYGYFRDELYYLDCADHLAWGYVDHSPLSIAILAVTKALFGTSLLVIRLPAVCAGAATLILTGLIAWRMGDGRFAQGLACLSVLLAPVQLGVCSFFSMNPFDLFFWALAVYALVRAVTTNQPRFWLWFGLVAGLGLMNKISMAFLGFGVVVGLALTHPRRYFGSKELWLGGLIAALVFLPNIIWQVRNGFPTLEFIDNATYYKIAPKSVLDYVLGQLLVMHPANAPIWIAGILYGLFAPRARPFRILSIMFLAVFALLALRGVKLYYLSPAFPPVLALGALWIERATASQRWIRAPVMGSLAVLGVALAPLALPLLSPRDYQDYTQTLGISVPPEERGDVDLPMPQLFADRFGWQEMVNMVAEVYYALEPGDRRRCAVLCGNYGEAGAINFFGRSMGLPHAISGHNSHYLWGPQGATGEVMLIYSPGIPRYRLNALFESVTEVGRFEHPHVMPGQNNQILYLCRNLKKPMDKFWRTIKVFM